MENGNYSNRKWIIISASDVTDEMINNAIQTSRDTLKTTLDGSEGLLKWDGNTPSCFDGIVTYNHSEIMAELEKSKWGKIK